MSAASKTNGALRRPLETVLDALQAAGCDPQQKGGQWLALCPAHDDTSPSLAISEGDDGRALLNCRSRQCSFKAIMAALRLKESDGFPSGLNGNGRVYESKPTEFESDEALRDHISQWAFLLPFKELADSAAKEGVGAFTFGSVLSGTLKPRSRRLIIVSTPGFEKEADEVAARCHTCKANDVLMWRLEGWQEGAFLRAVGFDQPWRTHDGVVWRYSPLVDALNARLSEFALTDLGNGERLVARHGASMRFCHPWSRWLVWDGKRWCIDQVARVRGFAKDTVRRIYNEAGHVVDDDKRKALVSWGLRSESNSQIASMIALASAEDGIPILPDCLDANGWLLNVQNGTVDLKAGKLRSHRREDLITAISPISYQPSLPIPTWLSTLDRVFSGNASLIRFWQRLCGLILTGEVSEQILPICYGTGANGKSTILGALLEILGPEYGIMAPPGLLTVKNGESHPTERAVLFGKRLVVDVESAEGARLNEHFVKQITGSDKISARRMREDFWQFNPSHKVILCTNHKPVIQETKHAIWRRIKLIPFDVAIPEEEQIKDLPQQLRSEYPGILAWCVQGCIDWQRNGLQVPEEVTRATEGYRNEQDVLGEFIDEECVKIDQARVKASALYARYRRWTEGSGEKTLTQRAFGMAMTERGFERLTNNGTFYRGLGLRESDSQDDGTTSPF